MFLHTKTYIFCFLNNFTEEFLLRFTVYLNQIRVSNKLAIIPQVPTCAVYSYKAI